MLPVLLLIGGAGALLFLAEKQKKSASKPRMLAGRASVDLRPPPELLAELTDLLANETKLPALDFAANTFESLGFAQEANLIREKRASITALSSILRPEAPQVQVQVPAPTPEVLSAKDLALALAKDAEDVRGGWHWDVAKVKSFQKILNIQESGIFDAATLGAMSFFVPGSRGTWIHSAVLTDKMRRAMRAEEGATPVSSEITTTDLQNIFASDEYKQGALRAEKIL